MFHSLSLRIALVAFVVFPQAIALFVFGSTALHVLENHVEQRMQKDLELVARAIQLPLSHALERDRMGSVVQALESAFSIGRVYSAYVYDNSGQEIAVAGVSDPAPHPGRLTRVAAQGEQRGEYGKIAGREVYSFFVPLNDSGGRINGLLQLTRRQSDFRADISQTRKQGFLWLLGSVVVISSLVLFGHHRALGAHVNRLCHSMGLVASGNRKYRLRPSGPKEIATLGQELNNMLDSMDRAQLEIEQRRATQLELESRLRRSEKLAAIGQVAAGVAHELGTPLSVIHGRAQRAMRESDTESPPTAWQAVLIETDRMGQIIRQLLDFSHRGSLHCRKVLPGQLVRSAVLALEFEAEAGNVSVEVDIPADAGPIDVDPVRIEQALVNLLRNALQAAPGGLVRISCQTSEHEGVLFRVEDDGPGVSGDTVQQVFEPFFTTKPPGKGTGLGLALVQNIVEEHGGEIEVERSELGGALFIIRLPAALARDATKKD